MVDERQRHAKRRNRLTLLNGMRLAPLATVADDSRTMLSRGFATPRLSPLRARTIDASVISALPFTL
jgi:hypothetical protein